MKASEAEKLICPFMNNVDRTYKQLCVTDKCMAWKMTTAYEQTGDKLPREQCEGYCRRIGE